ncbi:cupin domain-containing protein [Parasphingorhabdus sp. DH2-15]|uniref:cupin domain-containing protein n=1 Tax=Parasphingorhabdus sp. DH2-15 TaxID=3444112 RepID=UPI003F68724B
MDVLDDILDTLDLKGALYFRTDFSPPWSVQVPVLTGAARFHLVVQGKCCVELPDNQHVTLHAGDLILIPNGQTHSLSDAPVTQPPSLEKVLQDNGYDGQGVLVIGEGDPDASTRMICGHFSFRNRADHAILRHMQDYILITSAIRAENPWLDDILRLVSRQTLSKTSGLNSSIRRLSEAMFIELIRIAIENEDQRYNGLSLKGFHDPYISRALALMHQDPANTWSVNSLAKEVGMSRSSFADRFAQTMGQGPMSYLSDWRLQKALSLLEGNKLSIKQVAAKTGYHSGAAFTRAFAGKFGDPPSAHRRAVR